MRKLQQVESRNAARRRRGMTVKPGDRVSFSTMRSVSNAAHREACKRFGEGYGRGKPFDECENMRIEVFVDNKLAAVKTADGLKLVAQKL